MESVIVQRVFGRTIEKEKVTKFTIWFNDNLERLEETLDETRSINGEMTVDYQQNSNSFIIEVKTIVSEFAADIRAKYIEFGFDDSAIIGDVKRL